LKPDLSSEHAGVASPAAPVSDAEKRLSVIQEEVRVDAVEVETGAVRIRKVISEQSVPVPVRLRSQTVEVRRVSVNRPVDTRVEPRQEGDMLIIPVYEFVPIVTMQLTLKEEVYVTTRSTDEEQVQHFPVSKESIIVERREGANGEWRPDPGQDA
jgi:stress response protein YsnF